MQQHIEMNRSDITEGNPCKSDSCALALAISRANHGADVSVGLDTAAVYGPEWGVYTIYKLPIEARELRASVDNGEQPLPINFYLQDGEKKDCRYKRSKR